MQRPTRRALLAGTGTTVAGRWLSTSVGARPVRATPPEDLPPVEWSASGSGQLLATDGVVYRQNDGTVVAHDAATGEQQWSVQGRGTWGFGYLIHHDGSLYLLDLLDSDVLTVFDSSTGDRNWVYDPDDATARRVYFHGGVAYVGLGGQQPGLAALDPSEGRIYWRAEATGSLTVPAVLDGTVYGFHDEGYVGLSAESGDRQFDVSTPAWWSVDVDAVEGRALIGTETSRLLSYDVTTGERLWTREFGEDDLPVYPFLQESGPGRLFVSAEDGIHRIDMSDGSSAWNRDPFGSAGSPLVDGVGDRHVYFLPGNRLIVLTRESGEIVGHVRVSDSTRPDGSVRVGEQHVYAASGGTVFALAADGTPQWRWEVTDASVDSVSPAGDTVAVATGDRTYALDPDGPPGLVWSPDPPVAGRPTTISAGPLGATVPPDVSFEWWFGRGQPGTGDPPSATGREVRHVFRAAGTSTIIATARTDAGSATVFQRVQVREPTPTPTRTSTLSSGTDADTPTGSDARTSTSESTPVESSTEGTAAAGPGFGILASAAGAGVAIWRVLSEN